MTVVSTLICLLMQPIRLTSYSFQNLKTPMEPLVTPRWFVFFMPLEQALTKIANAAQDTD